ncbi:MAG TPA: endonuclease/exonuclease/phosphatase family protein [Kofleriaceae bacterium]|nr:endonuclease/exonuclease/phosphatase family protein [Kofleriaceae bacterium]
MRRWLAIALVAACGGGGGDRPDARPSSDARPPDADTTDAATAVLPEDLPSPLPSGDISGSFVSFNAGLIQVVKGGAERLPLQVTALKALDADLICMEEIWPVYTNGPEMAAALADTYPYSFWTWDGEFSLRNGLLIVSRHPLYRGRVMRYAMGNDGPTIDRMALGVTVVDDAGGWHANVVCTHMHAGLPDADKAIRLSEAQELQTWAASENLTDGPSILLGDFNSGPVPPSWQGICECSTEGELDAGPQICDDCVAADTATRAELQNTWTDCWAEDADFFTSSRDQFLQLAVIPGLFPDEPTQRIDHCMYKDLGGAAFVPGSSGTVLTEDPALDVDGETLNYLSDHYGIRCTFN